MTTRKSVPFLLWPFYAIWRLLALILEITGPPGWSNPGPGADDPWRNPHHHSCRRDYWCTLDRIWADAVNSQPVLIHPSAWLRSGPPQPGKCSFLLPWRYVGAAYSTLTYQGACVKI
jgi:hypothetical protein